MRLDAAGYSLSGPRQSNQDAFLINPELGLYLVADGVGGHTSGEIASELVCQVINHRVNQGDSLSKAIENAHRHLFAASTGTDREGMATTLVGIHVNEEQFQLCWVGDSRMHLWRDTGLRQLTSDQTALQELLDAGLISEQEAIQHPQRGKLTQALGVDTGNLRIGQHTEPLRSETILMLSTDGVTNVLSEGELAELSSDARHASDLAQSIVDTALPRAQDNCTCVVILCK